MWRTRAGAAGPARRFFLAFPRRLCDASGRSIRRRVESLPALRDPPEGFSLSEAGVRLARPEERPLWDALMDEHHYLGFRRLAGRGLRYVAVFRGQWLALAAWQNGAFRRRPRDRWAGWKPEQQFRRLEMIANNTRFLVLADPGVLPNLASFFLAGMTRRLAGDWLEAHGHRVLLAETFCDPERFAGAMCKAAAWRPLGRTKGFARSNGRYTDPHGRPKEIFVKPLRPDARRLQSDPRPLPPDVAPPAGPGLAPRDPGAMRSLRAELAAVPDFRRAQGRKHTVACVLAVHILAELANMKGCLAAAQFARSLSQEELAAVGAWRNPKTGLREPVSKSTLHRVVQSVDTEALEDVVNRWSRPRIHLARALAADGKRIRGANRNGGGHHETVALAGHETGAPFALLNFGDEGGETAAAQDLLERSDIRGRVITLDALHTTRKTAKLITQRCGADYVFTVKGNAPETFDILDTIDWGERRRRPLHGGSGQGARPAGAAVHRRPDAAEGPGQLSGRQPDRPRHPLQGAAEERPRRRRRHREGFHRDRLPHHLTRRKGRAAGGAAPAEPPPLGGGEPQPPPAGLRLRRGRLPDPHRLRPGEPGQPQQHRPRRGLRQPPRSGEPCRDPAAAAAEPERGHRRADTALRRSGVPARRNAARPPKNESTGAGNGAGAAAERGESTPFQRLSAKSAAAWDSPATGPSKDP